MDGKDVLGKINADEYDGRGFVLLDGLLRVGTFYRGPRLSVAARRREQGGVGPRMIQVAYQAMPHFKVILSGRGIDLAVGDDRAAGFITSRLVKADNLAAAESAARELVLSEWRSGGEYSDGNNGPLPALAVEQSFPVSSLVGIFGRRPRGYSFYRHEDEAAAK